MNIYKTLSGLFLSFMVLVGIQYPSTGFGQNAAPETEAPSGKIARQLIVNSDLYTATFSKEGGVLTSFVLKKYKEKNEADSPGMQIIRLDGTHGYPLGFSWGNAIPKNTLYTSDSGRVEFQDNKANLVLKGLGNGLEIERKYTFSKDSYSMKLVVQVKNVSSRVLQGAATLHQVGRPAVEDSLTKRFLFSGPTYYANESKVEIKGAEFAKGPLVVTGKANWIACECNYFINAVIPLDSMKSLTVQSTGSDVVQMTINGEVDTLQPGDIKTYTYNLFIGPKKFDVLKSAGVQLDKAMNFGWLNILAQPTLALLNFFYGICKNYGIAIILVTIIFRAMLWPITRKGMKSMINMQKMQPETSKIKEKYKGDSARRNQEIAKLYKTNKINPLGGCLPLMIQIPFFFTLYKVLLMAVELRHAPFMLWISDLSSPDRLSIGVDIPYLGGIPVLTMLMGGSMFLQQKMTAPTAGPIQAKILLFIPVIFTILFINFASGLVLYWLVSNLLAIFQHYIINHWDTN